MKEITGEEQLIRQLKSRIPLAVAEGTQKGLLKSALLVEESAQQKVPVDSAQLRESITDFGVEKRGEDYQIEVGTRLFYGFYIEFGTGIYAQSGKGRKEPWTYFNENRGQFYRTSGMPPRPFLYPAFREESRNFEGILKEEIRRALEGYLK